MKTRNHTLTAFLAASSIALAVPLFAQARPMMDGMDGCNAPQAMQGKRGFSGDRDGLPPMMKRLKLTPEQESKITQLRKQDADLMGEKFKTMRDSRAQLHEMQLKGEYDEAQVKSFTEKGAQAMAEMGQIRARQHHEMMQILTPEQRKQFESQRERMMNRGEQRREGRPAKG